MPLTSNGTSPCAACKLLRRRCTPECVFAPHFPADQAQKFAIVHRVFGASNTNKMLQELPADQRADAVSSLVYEAEARIRDPVYGCVGAIASLQQQVADLQVQLAQAKAETLYARLQQAPVATNGSSSKGSNLGVLPLASMDAKPLQLTLENPGFRKKQQEEARLRQQLRTDHSHIHGRALACVQGGTAAAGSDLEDSRDTKDGLLHPISLNVVRNNLMLLQDASPFSVDSVMDFGDMDSLNSINQMSPPTPPGSPDLLSPYSKPVFHSLALSTALW